MDRFVDITILPKNATSTLLSNLRREPNLAEILRTYDYPSSRSIFREHIDKVQRSGARVYYNKDGHFTFKKAG